MATIGRKRRMIPRKGPSAPRRQAKTDRLSSSQNSIAELRHRLQLTQSVFGRLIPISIRSLATLESGAPPSAGIARRLIELKRLADALAEVLNDQSLGVWLQKPNPAFNGFKPLEVIDHGESDRLWSMIFFLRSGTPS